MDLNGPRPEDGSVPLGRLVAGRSEAHGAPVDAVLGTALAAAG